MSSKKRQGWAKAKAQFNASLEDSGAERTFEDTRRGRRKAQHAAAQQAEICSSKKRYSCKSDADRAVLVCEAHGAKNLHSYRCPQCNGWHLTSRPQR